MVFLKLTYFVDWWSCFKTNSHGFHNLLLPYLCLSALLMCMRTNAILLPTHDKLWLLCYVSSVSCEENATNKECPAAVDGVTITFICG